MHSRAKVETAAVTICFPTSPAAALIPNSFAIVQTVTMQAEKVDAR